MGQGACPAICFAELETLQPHLVTTCQPDQHAVDADLKRFIHLGFQVRTPLVQPALMK